MFVEIVMKLAADNIQLWRLKLAYYLWPVTKKIQR